jgi:hypothetical protein
MAEASSLAPWRLGGAKCRDAMLKHLAFVLNGGSFVSALNGHGRDWSMDYSRLTWWLIGG